MAENIIIVIVVAIIIGVAARYIYKSKKRGDRCIGCPAGGCACCHAQDPSADSACIPHGCHSGHE